MSKRPTLDDPTPTGGPAEPAPGAPTGEGADEGRPAAPSTDPADAAAPHGVDPAGPLLGPADIRALADGLGLRPTKQRGQNFVIDANTVRRIVRTADLAPDDVVLEVGPGLGSLTLALLQTAEWVTAIEIDPVLAEALPGTVRGRLPERADRFALVHSDALRVTELPGPAPTALVANLPYNVAVPVLLHLLATFPTLRRGLVMVQAEVADRLAAAPGSRVYGVPSVKAAWYAEVRRAGSVGRSVFWPAPNVDSGLVALRRRAAPPTEAVSREEVFAVVDAAFAQRRKTLRAALAGWAGSAAAAEAALTAAGVEPGARGEALTVVDFAAVAAHRPGRPADREHPGRPGNEEHSDRPANRKPPGRRAEREHPGRRAKREHPGRPADREHPGRPGDEPRPGRTPAEDGADPTQPRSAQ